MRLGAGVERLHHRAGEDLDLLRHRVMRLHLPLKALDRERGVALLWHHGEDFGNRLLRVARPHDVGCETLADGLDAPSRHRLVTSRAMIAPAPATPATTAVAASVPSAVERSKAAVIHQ